MINSVFSKIILSKVSAFFVVYLLFWALWFWICGGEMFFYKFLLGSLVALAVISILYFIRNLYARSADVGDTSIFNFDKIRSRYGELFSEDKFLSFKSAIEEFFDEYATDHTESFRIFLIGKFSRGVGSFVGAYLGDVCMKRGIVETSDVEEFCQQNQAQLEKVIVSVFDRYQAQFIRFEEDLEKNASMLSRQKILLDSRIRIFLHIADSFTYDALLLLEQEISK